MYQQQVLCREPDWVRKRIFTLIFDKAIRASRPGCDLFFRDLHKKDDVIDDLANSIPDSWPESWRLYKSMNKLEDRRDQILEIDYFS